MPAGRSTGRSIDRSACAICHWPLTSYVTPRARMREHLFRRTSDGRNRSWSRESRAEKLNRRALLGRVMVMITGYTTDISGAETRAFARALVNFAILFGNCRENARVRARCLVSLSSATSPIVYCPPRSFLVHFPDSRAFRINPLPGTNENRNTLPSHDTLFLSYSQ